MFPTRGLKAAASIVLFAMAQTAAAEDGAVKTKPFFLFSDTTISYWHEFNGTEPFVGKGVNRDVVSLTHFNAWAYGTNFVNLDFLKSDKHDPAAPWGGPLYYGGAHPPGAPEDGMAEFYGLFRSTLSFNALTGTKAFSIGPLKDVSLEFGADLQTANTAFAPQKRDVVAGLQFAFNVPGYFNVGVLYYKEWNHNGLVGQVSQLAGMPVGTLLPGMRENVEFDGTYSIEANYMQPLKFVGLPLTFSGFTNFHGTKGVDGFGAPTRPELLSDNRLTLDVGALLANKPHLWDVFVGHRYWHNKFGLDASKDPTGGSTESTFYAGVAWHPL